MEEPDSSGSDVDQQPKIRETQRTTNKSESDVSYSDSESDENKEPESLLNVNKPQHVPGKYKQSIKPETKQETKTNEQSADELVANQISPDNTAGDASESKTSNGEETQASSHSSAEKDLDQTGIFEKSMLVIPSMPVDGSDKQKSDENVVSKERPPVPRKPSFDYSLSIKNDLTQVRDTSSKFRPNPAPRKSKLLSDASLDDKILLTDEQKRPKPSPRTKKKSDQDNLLPSPEKEENILPESTKFEGEFSEIENETFLEIPDNKKTVEEAERDLNTTTEENTDSIQTVDIGSANTEIREENYCDNNSYQLETDATLITDSIVKDLTENDAFSESFENVEAENRTVSHKVEDVNEAEGTIIVDKDNSDSEVAKFDNDFRDTDSSNSMNNDLNDDLNNSESESDDQFRTPDNQSEDEEHDFYDSHGGLAMDKDTVKTEDEQSGKPKESQEDSKNISNGNKHVGQAGQVETDFEESVVVLREKGTGYESISSTFSSSELTDVTLSKDKSLAETEERPPSVHDRISIFENFKYKSNENLGVRNVSIFDKSSSFEVLLGNGRNNSDIETDLCKENFTKAKDKMEKHEVVTDTPTSTEVFPSSDDVNESVVMVSADEIQIEWASSTREKTDVIEQLNNESNDVDSSDQPPPVPPKSEVVLESMRTSYLEEAPNIPPRSLRPILDGSLKKSADTTSQSGTLKRNTEHVLTDTQETTSSLPAVDDPTPESQQDGAQQQHTQPEESYYQNTQQPQPPAWNPFYYMDAQGNVQYINPYAFYNPNMNPGMFNPSASMPYFQQPQFYPPQYGTPQGQTPNIGADDSLHEYEEVSQSVKSEQIRSEVNAEQRHSLGTEERAHEDQIKSRNDEKHRAKPDKEHQRSPRGGHRNINNQQQKDHNQHGAHITEGAKLKKSKSDDPIKERVTKSKTSSSPVRRSMSSPTTSAKPGKRKDKQIRRLKEEDEVYEEVGTITDYYIYFKDISPNTKNDNLSNFIEATTKGESESEKVIFNYSRTCALVTVSMTTKPDLKNVKKRIQSRGIDGAKPEVYKVEPPKCIAVSSDEDIKSLESLGLYFESRKVADCEVEEDPYESEDGSCFVLQFSDPNVVKKVCGRQTPYVWEGRKLRVSPYFVCEAGAIWDSELHVVKIPGPVVILLEPSYLLLLQRECCSQLITKLESGYCLPTFTEEGLKLECTLTPKTPSFRSLVKAWEDASRCIVDTYIAENVIERQLESSAEVWKVLTTFFESEKYEDKTNLVASFNHSGFVILLVGFKDIVSQVLNELNKKQNDIEKQLRRRTETIGFEPLKLKLLEKVEFFEKVKKDTDDLEIFIGDGEITVDGQPGDISKVQISLYETDNKISKTSWVHGFSRDFVDFIKRKLVEKITSVLTVTGIVAEWEINDNFFIVYAYERDATGLSQANDYEMFDDPYSNVDDASTNAKDLIQSALSEKQEFVEDSLIEALTSPEWISFIESMTEDYEDVAEVEFKETTGKIAIYGMQKEAHCLHVKVKEFIDENSVKMETMKCGTINLRFIKMHKPDFTATLEKKFEHLKVKIEVKEENVIIRGTKVGIAKTKEEFVKIFNSIISEKHTIQKVAVKDVFRDVKDSGTIDVVEQNTGCLIKLPGENETFRLLEIDESNDQGPVQGATASRQATARSVATAATHRRDKRYKAPNGVIVSLVKGELGQQDGDVIVVTTAPNLNLNSGNACKSVLRAGGQRLQDECKQKYKTDIKFGEIAVIHGGGSLECNRVYLTTLPNWNSEHNPREILEKVMKDSLDLASKHQKHSILFCAMGTGQLKYPTDLVAMLMYQAVIDFDKNNPGSTLKDVRFVLYQKDYSTIKAFEAEEKIRLEGGGERQTFDLKYGNLTIELSVENIAEQKVDGILCSTCPKMDLSRNGACQALLRAGGKGLQDECKSKHNNSLEEGQVAEIGGGKLSCKSVFLTVLPGYGQHAIGVLTKVIQTLLQLAQAKSMSSLALPALGAGNLKYPKEEVCKCMFETVRDWAQKNPNSTIKTVRFIMHAKDHGVIQMFKSHIVNAKGRGKRESRHLSKEQGHPSEKRTSQEPNKAMFNAHPEGVQVGKIKVRVFKGDILSQTTDAVVSSVGKDFEFLGAVANELKTKFPKMEAKCHEKDKMQLLKKDGVVQTKGYGLPAKKVLHVQFAEHLPDWQKRIYKCLEIVNKNSFRSVAFPVLGTGKGYTSFNPEAIAGCMFDAISEFVQAYRSYSITEVRLIVYKGQPTMFDPIMDKLHKKVQEDASPSVEGTAKGYISKTVKRLKLFITGKEDGVMSEEDKKKLLDITSSMDILIYSDSKSKIDNCKKELDAKLEKVYTKRKIEDWKELIKSLTKEESKMLDIVALANIKVDSQAGIITIDGPLKQVSDVYDELYSNLLKIQRRRHEVSSAEELFKIVQWQYEEVTPTELKLTPYNKTLNQKIEKAYKENEPKFEFVDDDGDVFIIDFSQLIEYRKSDDADSLKVLRKDILKAAASALPDDWAQMKDNENIKVVSLPATDQTYKDIEQRFITEVKTGSYSHRLNFDPNNMKVNKIERIQNKTLFQQYQAKKKQMTEQKPNLPANMPIERELWHGTKADAITSIQMHGFNRSYSGNANGQPWYGDGVYFAANASYSARGWLSGAGTGSKGYMFLVKTLTGQFIKGQKGMRYLPAVDPKQPTILYDCAVDNPAGPMEYVIFNDTQAYPAYIITFTT